MHYIRSTVGSSRKTLRSLIRVFIPRSLFVSKNLMMDHNDLIKKEINTFSFNLSFIDLEIIFLFFLISMCA